jgi:hypothetical protein
LLSSRSPSPSFFSTFAGPASAPDALLNGWKIWSAQMLFTARCWTRPQTALAIATLLLPACVGVGSDTSPSACPPVVVYSQTEQSRLAGEIAALPEDALIIDWLADYAVLRDQARACTGR